MNKRRVLTSVFLLPFCGCTAFGSDWITAPSYYTHDPMSGERVRQYSPIGPFYTYSQPTFTRSGYRNTRSSIQVGTSADNYHVTEQWGRPIQPYGEWRFPYRPYSVPYDAWGPPHYGGYPYEHAPRHYGAGYGAGYGGAGVRGSRVVPPGQGRVPQPTSPGPNQLQPGYSGPQQLLDGRYPPFEQPGPFERKQLFDHFYPSQPRPGSEPVR